MEYNRKKHRLLDILFKKYDTNRNPLTNKADEIGLTFSEIQKSLKINEKELDFVLSELEKSKEIEFFDLQEKGCFINPVNGVLSLMERKYIKKNNNIIIGWLKIFTQIVIPILSLLIAIIVLSLKFNSITEKIELKINQKHKKEINKLERKLDSIINYNKNKIKE